MKGDDRYPVLNVRAEASRLGGLSSYGRTPDPEVEGDARRQLALSRIDRELRSMQKKGVALDPDRAAHVFGLLLSTCGVPQENIDPLEAAVVDVVAAFWGGPE